MFGGLISWLSSWLLTAIIEGLRLGFAEFNSKIPRWLGLYVKLSSNLYMMDPSSGLLGGVIEPSQLDPTQGAQNEPGGVTNVFSSTFLQEKRTCPFRSLFYLENGKGAWSETSRSRHLFLQRSGAVNN